MVGVAIQVLSSAPKAYLITDTMCIPYGVHFYSGKPYTTGFSSHRGCKQAICVILTLSQNAGKPHDTAISVPKLQLRSFSTTQNVTYPTFCVNYMQPHGESSKKPQTETLYFVSRLRFVYMCHSISVPSFSLSTIFFLL